jgi:homoserine kinase
MTVIVRVPATTANLGAGFDCIGAALSLYNQFQFTPGDALTIRATAQASANEARGAEADQMDLTASNLAYIAFTKVFERLGRPVPGVRLEIDLDVPLARGLGSSATAIVGGLLGANGLAGNPLSPPEIMAMAIEMEGHPDNVVPAMIGGCRLAASDGDKWEICDIPWHQEVLPVVAIPNFELSTAEARSVLPAQYDRAAAVFNIAHLGLLIRGLTTGNGDWLRVGLADKIHQPFRQRLIRGYEEVVQAAIGAGAYGVVISGAGPTILALAGGERSQAVAAAMDQAWRLVGVEPIVKVLELDKVGAKVLIGEQP